MRLSCAISAMRLRWSTSLPRRSDSGRRGHGSAPPGGQPMGRPGRPACFSRSSAWASAKARALRGGGAAVGLAEPGEHALDAERQRQAVLLAVDRERDQQRQRRDLGERAALVRAVGEARHRARRASRASSHLHARPPRALPRDHRQAARPPRRPQVDQVARQRPGRGARPARPASDASASRNGQPARVGARPGAPAPTRPTPRPSRSAGSCSGQRPGAGWSMTAARRGPWIATSAAATRGASEERRRLRRAGPPWLAAASPAGTRRTAT